MDNKHVQRIVDIILAAVADVTPRIAHQLGVPSLTVCPGPTPDECQISCDQWQATVYVDAVGELTVMEGNGTYRATIDTSGDNFAIARSTRVALAQTLGDVIGRRKVGSSAGRETTEPYQWEPGGEPRLTSAGYRDGVTLIQLAELCDSASVSGSEHLRTHNEIRRLLRRLQLGTRHTSIYRDAAYRQLPRLELVVRRHGRAARPAVMDSPARNWAAQVGMALGQSLATYLLPALLTRGMQRARYLVMIPAAAIRTGSSDFYALKELSRQAAETPSRAPMAGAVPRHFLERISLKKYVAAHAALSGIEATASFVAGVAAGGRDFVYMLGSFARRLGGGSAAGLAEGVTARRQVAASDVAAYAKRVAKRAEPAEAFAKLERESLQLHRGAAAVIAASALAIDERDTLQKRLRIHRRQQRVLFQRLAAEGHELAKLRTKAAPSDNISPGKRALIRVGPQLMALSAGAAVSAAMGNPCYALFGVPAVVQTSMHAMLASKTRREVSLDSAAVSQAGYERTHHDADFERTQIIRQVAGRVNDPEAKPIQARKFRRRHPYLWRAACTLPAVALSAVALTGPAALAPYALAAGVSSILNTISVGAYWEIDRRLYERKQEQDSEILGRIEVAENRINSPHELLPRVESLISRATALSENLAHPDAAWPSREAYEKDIATIALAELAWERAKTHLPASQHLQAVFPDEQSRTPHNPDFVALSQAITALPEARDADGVHIAHVLNTAFALAGAGASADEFARAMPKAAEHPRPRH